MKKGFIITAAAIAISVTLPAAMLTIWRFPPRAEERLRIAAAGSMEKFGSDVKIKFRKAASIPYRQGLDRLDLDTKDSYLLAKIAMAEAEGEDTEGKALVMMVVLNRVWSDKFPDTIEDVIYQPRQFSPVGNGRFDEVEPNEDCWAALDLIMLDRWDGSYGATYFESKSESTWHSDNLDLLFKHGNHYFYADSDDGY